MKEKQYRVVGIKDGIRIVITPDCSRQVARATAKSCDRSQTWDSAHVESRLVYSWKEVQ